MDSIIILTNNFENQTLQKEKWTHNAHIAVAFGLINKYKTYNKTLNTLKHKIKKYNISIGIKNTENSGYHETITIFWLKIVFEYYNQTIFTDIDKLYNKFINSALASQVFLKHFYSKELLFYTDARKNWREPDILPIEYLKIIIKNHCK